MKLELRNVSCGYGTGEPVLRNISMSLSGGEACCILGPNGVGKTTLFKTVLGLIPPRAGGIYIDGEDLSRISLARRARCFAYVAQSHTPAYPYRTAEIAMMGRMGLQSSFGQPTERDYEYAMHALEAVGIAHLADRVYTEISGGERQLLMIARARAQQPQMLIMDEPTASLDYGNMVTVMQCIRSLTDRGLGVIFTSHMPDQAFMSGAQTLLLSRTAPAVFGSADSVLTERNLYEAYHTDIQVLSVIGADGTPVKVVAPRFR